MYGMTNGLFPSSRFSTSDGNIVLDMDGKMIMDEDSVKGQVIRHEKNYKTRMALTWDSTSPNLESDDRHHKSGSHLGFEDGIHL